MNNFLTLHTEQIINGSIVLNQMHAINRIEVSGLVNDKNLILENKNTLMVRNTYDKFIYIF